MFEIAYDRAHQFGVEPMIIYAIARDVCLSVCLLARLLQNACMDFDEILRVDRCRDMDELIDF